MLGIRIPFFVIQAEDDPVSAGFSSRIIYTNRQQIACAAALPFQEMTQTPYGVMMTTSWGGHLGWFELGGGRWFVKPVCESHLPLVYLHLTVSGREFPKPHGEGGRS